MAAVYAAAKQYPNEVEHTYSFVQVLTACTASFAHGANDGESRKAADLYFMAQQTDCLPNVNSEQCQ